MKQRASFLNPPHPRHQTDLRSNAELDRLIAELRTHPLAEGELRQVKEGLYVSLSQSQPEGLEDGFCLSAGGRLYFLFSAKTVAGNTFTRIRHAVAALPLGSGDHSRD
jgi:hypothetical protein